MRIRLIPFAMLVAAFAIGSIPTVVLPTAASAESKACGYVNENGKLVFLGTCADTQSHSEEDAPAASNPCPHYRLEIAGC